MTAIEQLQQIGLNKYEAEAYYTLLAEGPLTGYELGKRSQVPLSRSYEILERLTQKGLALVQPGEPPRYSAQDPGQFLGQVRNTFTKTLDNLSSSLAALTRPDTAHEFWVLRGRAPIFERARFMIANAQRTLNFYLPSAYDSEMEGALALAHSRNCVLFRQTVALQDDLDAQILLLLADDREALVGTLTPPERSQAVVSANPSLVLALSNCFKQQTFVENSPVIISPQNEPLNWVAWEDRKQRSLWNLNADNRVA